MARGPTTTECFRHLVSAVFYLYFTVLYFTCHAYAAHWQLAHRNFLIDGIFSLCGVFALYLCLVLLSQFACAWCCRLAASVLKISERLLPLTPWYLCPPVVPGVADLKTLQPAYDSLAKAIWKVQRDPSREIVCYFHFLVRICAYLWVPACLCAFVFLASSSCMHKGLPYLDPCRRLKCAC